MMRENSYTIETRKSWLVYATTCNIRIRTFDSSRRDEKAIVLALTPLRRSARNNFSKKKNFVSPSPAPRETALYPHLHGRGRVR